MSLFVVIEVLNEDGTEVRDDDRDFDIEQLVILEEDRRADGYINLDGTNYVFNARIVGTVTEVDSPGDGMIMAVTPI